MAAPAVAAAARRRRRSCTHTGFRCFVSSVLLLNGLATLGAGAVCSFLPDAVLAFVTAYEPVTVSYVATAVLSVAGALMLCQTVLVAAAFVLWVQATQAMAMAFTVAVLVYTDLQWLAVLFLGIGFHDYEGFPSWVLVAQILGCAAFSLLNAAAVMWMFFYHRGEADTAEHARRHRRRHPGASRDGDGDSEDGEEAVDGAAAAAAGTNYGGDGGVGGANTARSPGSTRRSRAPAKAVTAAAGGGMTELEDPLLDRDGDDLEAAAMEEGDDGAAGEEGGPAGPTGKLADEEEKKYGFGRLFALVKPHICWLISGCVALLVRLPFSLAQPHFVSTCIGCLISLDYSGAMWNVAYLFIAGTIDSIMDFWCVYLFGYCQQKIIRSLRIDLFRAILGQEMGFFDQTPTGEITSRLTADTAEMANDLTWVFRFTIEALVRIGGIIVYMFFRSWQLALLACSAVPVTAIVNRIYAKWLAKNSKEVQTALAKANDVAQEGISSIRTVHSFAGEAMEHRRYTERIDVYFALSVRQVCISGIYYMFCNTFLVNTCVTAALLLYGSSLCAQGAAVTPAVTPEVLLSFMLYQGQLQEYFQNLFNSFTSLIKSTGAGAKVFNYLDRVPVGRAPLSKTGDTLPDVCGAVTFEGVSFCYPSRDVDVLRDVSFAAPPGKLTALVGASGSGKSTCFHLLGHAYEAAAGAVRIDGVDVRSLDHAWLHELVRLVGQEPVLFSGTVEDNILYGIPESKRELMAPAERRQRVTAAAGLANADGFIEALPNGYASEVGERGVQLSGGQKQRIAIARAIVHNPRILLLDEATSALDTESEGVVQEALERAMRGRTVLVIAHRLSTVIRADRIVVMDRGRVVEQGTHEELSRAPLPPPAPAPAAPGDGGNTDGGGGGGGGGGEAAAVDPRAGMTTYRMLIQRQENLGV